MKVVNDFLCASDSERWDDHSTAARGRLANDGPEPLAHVHRRRVIAITISRFHDDCISTVRRFGIANDWQSLASDVTAEHEPQRSTVLAALQEHGGGAEDVAGVEKGDTNAGHDLERLIIGRHSHQPHQSGDVALLIQWRCERLSVTRKIFRVLLLKMSGVNEHDGAEVACRGRAVHGAAVPFGREEW